MSRPLRKPTNLSIDSDLLEQAKAMDINLSRAAESGLIAAVSAAKAKRWAENNHAALESSNDYIDKHNLPLNKYRQF